MEEAGASHRPRFSLGRPPHERPFEGCKSRRRRVIERSEAAQKRPSVGKKRGAKRRPDEQEPDGWRCRVGRASEREAALTKAL